MDLETGRTLKDEVAIRNAVAEDDNDLNSRLMDNGSDETCLSDEISNAPTQVDPPLDVQFRNESNSIRNEKISRKNVQTPPLTIGLFDFVPKQEQRDFQNYLKSKKNFLEKSVDGNERNPFTHYSEMYQPSWFIRSCSSSRTR